MKFVPYLFEIEYWGVYDRGIPNQERLVFRPRIPLDMTQFFVALAIKGDHESISTFFDQAYWFPDVVIEPPSWVFLYTCAGTSKVTTEAVTKAPLHALFWGKPSTLFHAPTVIPVIFRIDGLLSPPAIARKISPADLAALGLPPPTQT